MKASKEKHSDSIPQEQPSVVAKDTVLKPAYSDLQIISYKKELIELGEQQQPLPSPPEPSTDPSISTADHMNIATTPTASLSNPQDNKPIDWDPDEGYARRLWARILEEKKQLGQEYLLINKEKQLIAQERRNLELEKKQLDYEQRNLETALAEVQKYRDILPSAKQLREMGVDLVGVSIWIEVIRNKAVTEGITPKETVALIVQELKLYNQFNSLKRSVERAQQDLEVLNMAVEQKQQTYRSLVDLKSKGVSDTDLVELNNLIYRWSAGGWSQSNGFNLRLDDKLNLASPNDIQQPSNGNNSYDDSNLSMSDLIRLNLLASKYYSPTEQNNYPIV